MSVDQGDDMKQASLKQAFLEVLGWGLRAWTSATVATAKVERLAHELSENKRKLDGVLENGQG